MKIEDIYEEWEKDSEFNQAELGCESARIPKLHNKYYRTYLIEGMKLRTLKEKFKILKRDRFDWYIGDLDKESIEEYGWEYAPNKPRTTKTEAKERVENDDVIVNETLKIAALEMKVKYLEDLIKYQINGRGFQIKNMIEWERFRTGSI